MRRIVLALTGASGAPIGLRLLEVLLECRDLEVNLIVSDHARAVCTLEAGMDFGQTLEDFKRVCHGNFNAHKDFRIFDVKDMAAEISSGSALLEGMIIAPCSMSTLAYIAHGITANLIHRTASVMLKERRFLILVPRESPLSPIHLRNMLRLAHCGVHIVPATLGFYNGPEKIQDLVDFVCARVLDLASIPHRLSKRWKGQLQDDAFYPRIQRYLE